MAENIGLLTGEWEDVEFFRVTLQMNCDLGAMFGGNGKGELGVDLARA